MQGGEDVLSYLTPGLVNAAWQLLTAEARTSLMGACLTAGSSAETSQSPALEQPATPGAAAAGALKALLPGFALTNALEVVSLGEQRTPGPANLDASAAAAAAAAAAGRGRLAASAALAVRRRALAAAGGSAAKPWRPAACGVDGAAAAAALSWPAAAAAGVDAALRLAFLAAMGDVAFFPEAAAALGRASGGDAGHAAGRSPLGRLLLPPGLQLLRAVAACSQVLAPNPKP